MKSLWNTLQTIYPSMSQQQRQIRKFSKQKLYHKCPKNKKIRSTWILMSMITSYPNNKVKEQKETKLIWWKTEVYVWSKYLVFIYKVNWLQWTKKSNGSRHSSSGLFWILHSWWVNCWTQIFSSCNWLLGESGKTAQTQAWTLQISQRSVRCILPWMSLGSHKDTGLLFIFDNFLFAYSLIPEILFV